MQLAHDLAQSRDLARTKLAAVAQRLGFRPVERSVGGNGERMGCSRT